jgi:hypothetical protein
MSGKISAEYLSLGQMNDEGDKMFKKGHYAGAVDMYRASMEGRTKKYGAAHPDTLLTMDKLAEALEFKKSFAEANDLYKKSLKGKKRILGDNHKSTCDTALKLGELRRKIRRESSTYVPLYHFAYEGYKISLGTNDSVTRTAKRLLDEVKEEEKEKHSTVCAIC